MSQFDRVAGLFRKLRHLDGERRRVLLEQECGDDHELRDEVLALLADHDRPDAPLDGPALGPGFSLMGGAGGQPDRIGAYRIREPIGAGGMGVVYLAEQDNPRRTVALKLIRPGFASDDVLRRFEHEALALGQLHHPGIAQIHEAGIEDGVPFIAMERVEGSPLLDYVRAHDLDRRERLVLFCHICDAVQHAHQKGIIHRDLKPGNILVEGRGAQARPKVLDFGVARLTDSDVQATTLRTGFGELLGTVQYMSPEQASGDPQEVDTRSDVYALGVILFELLSGRLPHDLRGKLVHEAVRIIQMEDPTSLVSIDSSYRGDLDTVVNKALEREKERRYATAAELAEDLRRHLRDEPIAARPPSAGYHLSKFARRHRTFVLGVVAVFVALVLGLLATLWQWQRAVSARNAESEARAAAEQRFREVRSLANTFIHEFDSEIMHLPGALEARRMIVTTALEYLDRLSAEELADDSLRVEVASAYQRVGDIQGAPRTSNLGDAAGALVSYDKALALFDTISDREGPGHRRARALLLARIGDLVSAAGHIDEALDRYRQARGLLAGLPRVRAQVDARIADALITLGRPAEALETFRALLAESRALADASPDDPAILRDLAVDHFKVSICLERLERFDESLEHLRSYQELSERIVRLRPDHSVSLRDLAVGHERLCQALSRIGQVREATAEIRAAIAIDERLVEADPGNAQPRIDLATHLVNLGEQLLTRGIGDEAEAAFVRSRGLVTAIAGGDPGSATPRRLLGVVLYKLGEVGKSRAVDDARSVVQRIESWQATRSWMEQAREVFRSMERDGILSPLDAAVPGDLTREIEVCDREVQALRGGGSENR